MIKKFWFDENFNLRFFINAKILNLKENKNKNSKEIFELSKKAISKIDEDIEILKEKKQPMILMKITNKKKND